MFNLLLDSFKNRRGVYNKKNNIRSNDTVLDTKTFPMLKEDIHALVIADTHDGIAPSDYPITNNPYDLLICLGDVSYIDWLEIFNYDKYKCIPVKIGITGNHYDVDFTEINKWLLENDETPIIDIHGKIYSMLNSGITFSGIRSSAKYKHKNNLLTQKEAYRIAEAMSAADILLSHSNPKKEFDICDDISPYPHAGLYGVTHYMEKHEKCKYNLHGHVHDNYVQQHISSAGQTWTEMSFYKMKDINITTNGIEIIS